MSIKKIRPYARLITMLGEQLIKNEQFALSEIIKNSYDADADWVKVEFVDFDDDFSFTDNSKIVITDNGKGMSEETIENHWMNPATYTKKSENNKPKTSELKKRIIQGEKGIGRFSLFKLGKSIEVITRPINAKLENRLIYNFSLYDDEFTKVFDAKKKEWVKKVIYLDDLDIHFSTRIPITLVERTEKINSKVFKDNDHGTQIIISDLKGKWSYHKYERSFRELAGIQSGLENLIDKNKQIDFDLSFFFNGLPLSLDEKIDEHLQALIENNAVISVINGHFDNQKLEYSFKLNGISKSLSLASPEIQGLNLYKSSIWKGVPNLYEDAPQIGNFSFTYFIFDFNAKEPSKYHLNRLDKELLKKHRVYLFRDNIRVYPYGNPEDDWLQIDIYRGTVRAGDFVSNDQTLGWIEISKEKNPKLKDKTNREGLIDVENLTQAFIDLNKIFLSWIRTKPYKKYQIDNKRRKEAKENREEQLFLEFGKLSDALAQDLPKKKVLDKIQSLYVKERDYLNRRVELTEELAGVGLSVETASHDLMLMLNKGLTGLHELTKDVINESINFPKIEIELNKLSGMFSFVHNQVQDIQLLFTSSKRRRKNIRVIDILEKVAKFYERVLKKANISYEIEIVKSPLIVKCTDAVLMQTFINLFDNSFYWLSVSDIQKKTIRITLNGMEQKLIFSDNGPGIHKEDLPYIFEAFYSGKGEEGRGLGLYISKKLLNKSDYDIEVAEVKSERLLSGANFVITFVPDK